MEGKRSKMTPGFPVWKIYRRCFHTRFEGKTREELIVDMLNLIWLQDKGMFIEQMSILVWNSERSQDWR